ncbi:YkvA family protein [Spirulina major CS-329]|uniref:YkvA family protein n=1 Tax=Spirulina TaxID=1154 RepID=UPI00232BE37B|nr:MULTISPECIES: YkvA family protein [Spirulina]MDB9495074.1 YkvA family protein [Spirulina subsalsa CS-330]MDB9504236.1 YkvA family protein [Spirulina major CS-329]
MFATLRQTLRDRTAKLTQRFRSNADPTRSEAPASLAPEPSPPAQSVALTRPKPWQALRSRWQTWRNAEAEGSDTTLEDPLDQIDQQLEQGKTAKIKRIFHDYIRKAKPEDVERINENIGSMQRGPVKEIWSKVEVLVQLVRDPQAAWKSKALAIASLIYLISPIDAIPDVIPIGGLVDDVALIVVVVSTLAGEVETYLVRQAEQKAEIEIRKYNNIVRIALTGSIFAALITIAVNYSLKHL